MCCDTTPDRVVPERPLERGRRFLLLAVRDDDRRVHVEHHRGPEPAPGRGRLRDTAGDRRPHMLARPGPRSRDLLQLGRPGHLKRPPGCQCGRDRAQHALLVTQDPDVIERPTTIEEHRGDVHEDPPTIVDRDEVARAIAADRP